MNSRRQESRWQEYMVLITGKDSGVVKDGRDWKEEEDDDWKESWDIQPWEGLEWQLGDWEKGGDRGREADLRNVSMKVVIQTMGSNGKERV